MESSGSKSKEGGQDQTLWCCGPLEEFCCVADVDKVVYRTDGQSEEWCLPGVEGEGTR